MRIVFAGFALLGCSGLLGCSSLTRPDEISIVPEPPTPAAVKAAAPAPARPAAQAAPEQPAGCGQ
jgi:hypothetical protein